MSTNRILLDGRYTRGFYVGRPRLSWPFSKNGDNNSIVITREWRQSEATYLPGRRGVDKDPKYRDAYLILDTEPEPTGTGDVIRVTRTFARIPTQQITGRGVALSKPSFSGDSLTVRTFGTIIASLTAIYDSSLGAFLTSGSELFGPARSLTWTRANPTAGTFTLTYKTSTTAAIAYNATASTINTALNGLADVISDGLTFSANISQFVSDGTNARSYLGLTLSAGTTSTAVTMNAASLTTGTSDKTWSTVNSTTSQTIFLSDHLTILDHGLDPSDPIIVQGDLYHQRYASGSWDSYSANVVRIPSYNDGTGNTYRSAAPLSGTYSGGLTNVIASVTEKFYLPGISPGIASFTDIPVDTPTVASASGLMAALFAGTGGWAVYDSEGPDPWRDSPIYRTAKIEINLSAL